ncbi:MAG: cell division protein ZapA [Thiohalomonadales bacterium]
MSQNEQIPVTVRILDREYQIACRADEKNSLLESARYLDAKMKEIRGGQNLLGSDRVAVMAALHITHDYLQDQNDSSENGSVSRKQILNLQQKLDMALSRCKQAELLV